MTYMSGQFKNIVPYILETPDAMILAGPADGDEAHCALAVWPNLRIIGLEPVDETRCWQLENGWPTPETLLPHALSDKCGTERLTFDDPSQPDLMQSYRMANTRNQTGGRRLVSTVTLDYLNTLYGPFRNLLVWMDIEGAELKALKGAKYLLSNHNILAINLEAMKRDEDERIQLQTIHTLLEGSDMELAGLWGNDRVYRRK